MLLSSPNTKNPASAQIDLAGGNLEHGDLVGILGIVEYVRGLFENYVLFSPWISMMARSLDTVVSAYYTFKGSEECATFAVLCVRAIVYVDNLSVFQYRNYEWLCIYNKICSKICTYVEKLEQTDWSKSAASLWLCPYTRHYPISSMSQVNATFAFTVPIRPVNYRF